MSSKRILTAAEKGFLTRPHARSLWGEPHEVTPALVKEIFGDGRKLVCLSPIMTRPNYYVVQVDSNWALDNFAEGETFADHLDEVYEAIEEQFGNADCDCGDCEDLEFPALHGGGSSWGEIDLDAEMKAEARP